MGMVIPLEVFKTPERATKESGKKHLPNREARKPECPPKKQLLSLRKAFNNNGE